ncbi:unnamed protein product [Cuscuta epithymum]|uniref:Uncharacterized protein n=1 Tax=Cuscuta epithymum TaxID=186058 RepID=A0AAV0CHV8_9ASTE|nr:unnamed protein product [Cuscuta epithymum]CAH9077908.1 unnamed protein product [Cuscuta epithymum]
MKIEERTDGLFFILMGWTLALYCYPPIYGRGRALLFTISSCDDEKLPGGTNTYEMHNVACSDALMKGCSALSTMTCFLTFKIFLSSQGGPVWSIKDNIGSCFEQNQTK